MSDPWNGVPPGEWAERDGIYVASRASVPERAAMWRGFRECGFPIISSWIDEDGPGQTASMVDLWARIVREVSAAKALVLFVGADDLPLKGAYVEVGIALATSIPVLVVCAYPLDRSYRPLGSWAAHPRVTFYADVDAAMQAAIRAPCLPPADLAAQIAAAVMAEREAIAADLENAGYVWARDATNDNISRHARERCQLRADQLLGAAEAIRSRPAPAGADALEAVRRAAYREGWQHREADIIARTERMDMVMVGKDALAERERAARRAALEEAARIARDGCLVPPDGGSPSADEVAMCDGIAAAIRALMEADDAE